MIAYRYTGLVFRCNEILAIYNGKINRYSAIMNRYSGIEFQRVMPFNKVCIFKMHFEDISEF